MARTSPGYQVLINYMLRCVTAGAIASCYSSGEETLKKAGSVIGLRDLAKLLINAKSSREEVNKAIQVADSQFNRDMVSP
jgi:hypothetical protein